MIQIYPDAQAISRVTAQLFILEATAAIQDKGSFLVSLSGGSTPRLLYEELAKSALMSRIDWSKVYVFWGDERHVPPDDERSNQKMTEEAWLSRAAIPRENIFPIPFAASAELAAEQYEESLRRFFHTLPRFDLTLLGLGTDGHTASLFPGTEAVNETVRWACAARLQSGGPERVTLTFPVLNQSAMIWFLAAGSDKAEIIQKVFTEPDLSLPVQKISPAKGKVTWFLDEAAALELPDRFIKGKEGQYEGI